VTLNQPVADLPVIAAENNAAPTPAATADDSAAQPTLPNPTPTSAPTEAATIVQVPSELAAAVAEVKIAPASAIKAQAVPGLSGRIVFQDGRNNIYVYDLASGNVTWLTNGYDPDVSRDGAKVTFVRGGGSDNGVWSINMDGSDAKMVYGSGDIIRSPKWSPDGKWIVFSRISGSWKCFDIEFFGCMSFSQLQSMFPKIPPPILYRIFLRGTDRLEFPNWGISRVNPDGGEFRDLNALDSAVAPDWNEAGIVYESRAGLEITEDTPDGQTRSVFHGDWDWDPDWAPNGGRILYQSKEGSHWELWTVNPDGSDIMAVTHPETTLVDQLPSNVAGAYSPDGQQIVYLSNRDAGENAGPWRLWVMNSDGSGKRPLPIDVTIDYGFSNDQVASWAK
jgi:Tol biopolymer transport system component